MVVGADTRNVDVAVIGGGPGGYMAAIRLGQLGRDVLVIEKRQALGGVCLHEGCIPSKALIHASSLLREMRAAHQLGIQVDVQGVDLGKLVDWKDGVVHKLTSGVGTLVNKYGVDVLKGTARFTSPRTLAVETVQATTTVSFDHAIIATGTEAMALPEIPFDPPTVIGSREALSLRTLPDRLAIIGGGYIGLELASVFSGLGTQVDVVEVQPSLLPDLDPEVGKTLTNALRHAGVTFHLGARARNFHDSQLSIMQADNTSLARAADHVLVCVGRKPTLNLGLDAAGVSVATDRIEVDRHMRTSAEGIYAIGDIVSGPPLAHKAYREAHVAAEHIAGEPAEFDNRVIPAVVYTDPEVAWVGMTENRCPCTRLFSGHRNVSTTSIGPCYDPQSIDWFQQSGDRQEFGTASWRANCCTPSRRTDSRTYGGSGNGRFCRRPFANNPRPSNVE